jgi:hypothetical protein
MTASRPEARTEYSRGTGAVSRLPGPLQAVFRRPGAVAAAGAVLGALVLILAEFTRLYSVHVSTATLPVGSVTAGSHDAYALLPVAVLAALLGLGPGRRGSRPALAAIVVLGLFALALALLRDLPAAHAHGLTSRLALASTSPGPSLYIETLGSVVLIVSAGVALLQGHTSRPARPARRPAPGLRSES